MAARITVTCPSCSWTGLRTAAGGPCPRCQAAVEDRRTKRRGHRRVLWTLRVDPGTREALTPGEAARILDEHVARQG